MNNSYNYYSDNNYDRVNYDILFGTFGVDNTIGNSTNNFNMDNNMNNSMNNNINNNMNSSNNLFGPYEGYKKGNMFKDLYQEYKNYKPANLTPTSEQEEALLNLNQMHFAMHEANLLLDVNPSDASMMSDFTRFRDNYNNLLNNYQQKYGALNVNSDNLNNVPFGWEDETWPWDRRGL